MSIQGDLASRATTDAGYNIITAHFRLNVADMTSACDVSDTPASGKRRSLTDLIVSVGSVAMNVSIRETTTGSVVNGPYYLAANNSLQFTTRGTPLSETFAIDEGYEAIASAAGDVTVETWTYDKD